MLHIFADSDVSVCWSGTRQWEDLLELICLFWCCWKLTEPQRYADRYDLYLVPKGSTEKLTAQTVFPLSSTSFTPQSLSLILMSCLLENQIWPKAELTRVHMLTTGAEEAMNTGSNGKQWCRLLHSKGPLMSPQ